MSGPPTELEIRARRGHPDFLDLPWERPLLDWDVENTEGRLVRMAHGVPATVTHVEYHGAFVLHTVRLPSGRTVRSWQPHSVRYPVGTEVLASIVLGIIPSVLVGERTLRTSPSNPPTPATPSSIAP